LIKNESINLIILKFYTNLSGVKNYILSNSKVSAGFVRHQEDRGPHFYEKLHQHLQW